jgi:SAM-dependent methyltransferase
MAPERTSTLSGRESVRPGSAQESADLAQALERLYRRRFSEADLRELRTVWRVLVRDFFQKRIDASGAVLDVGAGACLFINEVEAARRIAVDANPDLPRHAAPGVETIVTDDLSLHEISDESLGCVFLSNFLEHLPDHLAVLRLLATVYRKLRVGGSLMILQPNFRLEPRRYFDFLDHRMILTDASLVEALETAGFRIAELEARFLPFTSKSRMPKWEWAVRLYLRVPPARWLLGKQTFVRGIRPPSAS